VIVTEKKLLNATEKSIKEINYIVKNENLKEPIHYILSLGGKRMRPMLVLLAYNLYKDNYELILQESLVVELFHNFTLIHDDIMDNAPLRRGSPTVHNLKGTNAAILAGDALLIQAYSMLENLEPTKLSQVLFEFNRCAVEVCEGQQLDLIYENHSKVSVDDYILMIKFKTAVLLGFSLKLGGILANAPEKDINLLYNVGIHAGIGFQIMDDYLDVFGDSSKIGKKIGGDILINKKTFLLCKLFEIAHPNDRYEIEKWIYKKEFNETDKILFFKTMFEKYSIQKEALKESDRNYDFALKTINKLSADLFKKGHLKNYLIKFMNRES